MFHDMCSKLAAVLEEKAMSVTGEKKFLGWSKFDRCDWTSRKSGEEEERSCSRSKRRRKEEKARSRQGNYGWRG
jgi:hypothetical protein